MPVSMDFLRGVLGMFSLGCAFMAGRSLVAFRKGWQKLARLYGWLIRMTVCLGAVAFRNSVDVVEIAIWVLAGAAFAGGCWSLYHQKPPEDLSRGIFPE